MPAVTKEIFIYLPARLGDTDACAPDPQTTARRLLEAEAADLRRLKERAAVTVAEAEAEASQAGIAARGGLEARRPHSRL